MANWLWFTRAHCALYRATGGLIGENLIGIHMLLLTTTGRKTGKQRTLPLAYVEDRGDFVVVASNGGAERPPAWWLNLQSAETAAIQVRGDRMRVRWSLAPEEEKMEHWRMLQAAVPAYRRYRLVTDREIPIVRLRPIGASADEDVGTGRQMDGSPTIDPPGDANRGAEDRGGAGGPEAERPSQAPIGVTQDPAGDTSGRERQSDGAPPSAVAGD